MKRVYFKKVISIILTLCMLIPYVSNVEVKGMMGDTFIEGDLKYLIFKEPQGGNNGTVHVGGNNKEATELTIPSTVTNNGNTYDVVAIDSGDVDEGFYGYNKLTSITIPDSITSIGKSAFYNCSSLTSIEIPSSVTSIGEYAFYNCSSLTNIEIPSSVTSIGNYLFSRCSGLTSIKLPNSITSIGNNAFAYCSSLTNIEIPDSVTFIDSFAFSDCNNLKNVTILSDKLNSLSINAFDPTNKSTNFYVVNENTKNLLTNSCDISEDKIKIVNPSLLHKLKLNSNGSGTVTGDGTFEEGTTVTITATTNEGYKFDSWSVNSGEVTLEDSTLAQTTFIMPATDVEITANFSEIKVENTFIDGDLKYEVITQPQDGANGTVNVSGNNKEAMEVTIPSTVTNSGNTYDVVTIKGTTEEEKNGGFYYYEKLISVDIPDSITSIGNSAFRFCSSLTNIELPDSITSIGEYAFTGCSGFTDIELPNSITSISMATFWGCSSLTSVEIPNSVTSINISAFSECNKLENIIILSDKLEKLASDAFDLNSENTNFYVINENIRNQLINTCKIPEDRIEIIDVSKLHRLKLNSNGNGTVTGDGTFEEGKTVTITATANDGYEFNGWTVNSGDVTLEDSTLAQTTFIMPATDVEITANFSEIKVENTFIDGDLKYEVITQPQNGANGTVNVSGNNKEATEVIIPETVTNNGNTYDVVAIKSSTFEQQDTGFYDYKKLINITIPNSITSIGDYAFRFCSSLTNIELPSSITYIGKYAFDSCRSLTDIELPDSITSIGISAFGGCSKLINIKIPNSVTSINVMAFDECSDLTSIEIPNSVTSINISAFGRCSNLENIIILSDKLETLASDAFDLSNENIEFYVMNQNIKNQLINTCKVSEDKIKVTDVSKLHRLNLNSSGNGTVTSNSRYIEGKIVTIKATAKKDYKFDSWTVNSGNVTLADSTSAQTTFTMPAEDVVLTANFREKTSEDVFTDGDLKYEVITQPQDGANGTVNVSGNNKEVTKITIPKTVTNNGNTYDVIAIKGTTFEEKEGGFYEYEKLISIEIPDSITSIGAYAFYTCKSLTSIELPDSVTTIGDNAFYTCKSLTSIELPDSVTTIGNNAFQDCINLTSIKLPNFVTTIGRTAFNNCENLTSIKLPNSITSIDMFLFARCLSLTSIEIPNSITSISSASFFSCSKLENITILSDKLQSLDKVTFQSVSENAKFYVINEDIRNQLINTCEIAPDKIEIIDAALLHTLKLNSNDNGTAFGSGTYMENGTVSIIATANDGYEFDGWSVNSGNVTLTDNTSTKTTFTMPNEDVEITANFVIEKPKYTLTLNTNSDVSGAVYGSGSYKAGEEITITATPKTGYEFDNWSVNSGDVTLEDSTLAQTTFIMPEGNVEITANFSTIKVGDTFVDGDLKYEVITQPQNGVNGTVNVSGNNKEATSITIPKTVTNKGNTYDVVTIKGTTDDGQIGGFCEYTKLISIEIPVSITSIGNSAFWGCNNLTSIKLPDSITSIGNSAFERCSSLTNIELPTSITSIDYRTFSECSSLTNIELPTSITSIGSSAFYGCSSLTSIELPTSITSIGIYTFKNCSKLESITILSDKLELLSVDAFDLISENAKFYVVNKDIKDLLINKCSISKDKIEIINSPTLHTLKLNSNGNGTVTGDGTYMEGDTVTITATANDGYEFDGWSVNSGNVTLEDGTLAQTTFIMPANDVEITANFSKEETKYILTLNTNSNVSGTVYGSGSYKAGEEITITATPKTGYKFDNWTVNSGDVTLEDSTLAQTTFTMPEGNVEITANFSTIKVRDTFVDGDLKYEIITLSKDGANGTVNVSGNNKEATSITIPRTVTNKGNTYDVVAIKECIFVGDNGGFSGCEKLTSIKIPDSITYISNAAFYECINLRDIELPNSITSIGDAAFTRCSSLTSIELPNFITYISDSAFLGCSSLTSIELPSSITYIGADIFAYCNNLENITILSYKLPLGYGSSFGTNENTKFYVAYESTKNQLINNYGISADKIEIIDAYSLELNSNDNGVVFGSGKYIEGKKVTIKANPNGGYKFDSWIVNSNNINLEDKNLSETTFIMPSEDVEITASFLERPKYILTLSPNSDMFGTVYDSGSYKVGETVTIKATANDGYKFDSWTVNSGNVTLVDSTSSQTTFIMPANDVEITANFSELPKHTLVLNSNVAGEVYGSGTYMEGKTVTITAIPNDGYKFDSWIVNSGNVTLEDGTLAQTTFIMPDADVEITANFVIHRETVETDNKDLIFNVITKPEGETNGTVSVTASNKDLTSVDIPETIKDKDGNIYTVVEIEDNAFKDCVNLQEVKLPSTITVIGQNAFDGCIILQIVIITSDNVTIGDDAFTNIADNVIFITTNDSVKDKLLPFVKDESQIQKPEGDIETYYSVILKSDSNGTVKGNGIYKQGDTVTITATANDGYEFDGWSVNSGNVTLEDSTLAQTTFTMPEGNVEITANFSTEETKYILTLNTNDDVWGAVYGSGSYKAGEEVTITATPKTGYKFDNWTVNSGDVTLADSTLAQTTFTMPEGNVEITANFSTIKVGDTFVDGDLKYEIITLSKDGANGTVNVSGNNKEVTSITIPEIVTNNGNTYDVVAIRGTTFKEANGGFYEYEKLTNIEIPDSITSIGDLAFNRCSNLTNIKLPDFITSIGDYAFRFCSSLTNIKLPDSITSINDYAFAYCSSLTNIKLPDSITSIGEHAFSGCSSLTNIELPDSITSINNYTFYGCTNLTDIKLPNSLASIGDFAFDNCSNLTNIKLPDSITSIGYSVFAYCSSLTSIKLPDSITSIGDYAFAYCSSLTDIKLPNSITSISAYTFYKCSNLKNIELPSSITSIDDYAFNSCSKLENITILSDKLKFIYSNTFNRISENAKFYVVNETIKKLLINECNISADKIEIIDASKLHTLKLNPNDNGTVSGSGSYMEGKTVTITATAKEGYKFDSWSVNSGDVTLEDNTLAQTTFVMPANDVEITANFVGNNETVETPNKDLIFNVITKPEGETNGTVSVTVNNKDLTSVDIPETIKDKDGNTYTVVEIEDNAFKDCGNLQHIKLPNTIITIGQGAFENCTNLIEITIPSGVTSIGDNAFKGCIILQIVVIISVNITIGKDAFTNVADNVIYITTNNDIKDKLKPFVKDENQIQVSDGNVKDTSSVIIRTSAGGIATGNGLYKSGDTVNLKTTAKDGYKFDKWIVISGDINIENINSETTSFTMLDKNVILMANFVSNGGNSENNNVGDSFVTDDKFIVTVTKPAGSDTQGTVTIVGTTDTSDTITIPNTITDKNGKVYKITFVSDNAFTGNKNIISIIIQNGITSIGNGAFKDCVNLIHISIPNSVTSIGDSAFENCTKLEKIEIPSSVILIGNNAFKGCINLSKIIILTIKVIIKNNVFENISKDASFIVINQEIKNILIQIGIAESQIVISKGLHKVTVKSDSKGTVTGSGTYSKDDTVTIKATPNDGYKFDKWTVNTDNVTLADDKLAETTFMMPDENVEVTASFVKDEIFIDSKDNLDFIVQKPATENEEGEVIFKVKDKNVTSINIPSKVKDNKGNSYVIKIIPNNAFEGCTNLKEITIPETIISIGDSAFKGCTSLIKIILPNTITVIGSNAFEGCVSLIEITIPKNVELIKDNAFLNCTSLIKVIILSLNLQIATNAFTGMSSNTIFMVLNQEVKAILILCHILEIQIVIMNPELNLQEQIDRANEILMKSYPTLDEVIQSTIDLSDGIVDYFQHK